MFLRQFDHQTAANLYAIKGGCNLRFFFNSYRYSEDLDLDVQTMQPQTLENKVNKIINTRPLLTLLQSFDSQEYWRKITHTVLDYLQGLRS